MQDKHEEMAHEHYNQVLTKLQQKLDPKTVKYREQAGRRLAYIDGFTAINNANQAFGHLHWNSEVIQLDQLYFNFDEKRNKWVAVYAAHVRVSVENPFTGFVYNSHTDWGVGQGIMANPSDSLESAIKEAVTDGLKRALRYWGPQFGLDLYSEEERREQGLDNPNGIKRVPAQPQPQPQSQPQAQPKADNEKEEILAWLKARSSKPEVLTAIKNALAEHGASRVGDLSIEVLKQLKDSLGGV